MVVLIDRRHRAKAYRKFSFGDTARYFAFKLDKAVQNARDAGPVIQGQSAR